MTLFRRATLAPLGLSIALLVYAFSLVVVGGVEIWAQAVMGLATAAAFAAVLVSGGLRPADGPRDASKTPVRISLPEAFLLGIVVLGVVQLVPLPPALFRALSPEAAALVQAGAPAAEAGRWHPLSVYPFATRVELVRFVTLALAFSLFARAVRRPVQARGVLAAAVGIGAAAALLAIADQFLGGALLGFYPREARHAGRLAGLLVNPNHFAGLMAVTAILALGLHFSTSPLVPSAASPFRATWLGGFAAGTDRGTAVAVLLGLLATTAALLLTASRLGVFAFLVGTGFFVTLLARGREARRALTGIAVAAALVLLLSALVSGDPVLRRWSLFFDGSDTAEGRVKAIGAAAEMGEKYLVFGAGMGTFGHVFPSYQPENLGGTWDHAHNDFVELFADTGLAGAVLAIGFLVAWCRVVAPAAVDGPWERRGIAAAALASAVVLLVHAFGDFDFQIPAVAFLLVVVLGTGYGVSRAEGAPA